jgi:hypothetical protein
MTTKISLRQQIEAVRYAETRQRAIMGGGSLRELRPSREAEYDMRRLGAAARTLEWLLTHEDEIKAFLALDPTNRASMICQVLQAAADKLGGPDRS